MKEKRQKSSLVRFVFRMGRKTAATVVEYTVIVAIVSIAAVVILVGIGSTTNSLLQKTNTNFPQ